MSKDMQKKRLDLLENMLLISGVVFLGMSFLSGIVSMIYVAFVASVYGFAIHLKRNYF